MTTPCPPDPDDFDDDPTEALIYLLMFLLVMIGGICLYLKLHLPPPP